PGDRHGRAFGAPARHPTLAGRDFPMLPTHRGCALVSVTDHHHRQLLSADHLHHGLLAELVTGLVRGYGFTACPDYEPSSFILFFDNSKFTNPPTFAGSFLVDRRAGAGYEENRYYSQAPLRTADHIALLNELEKLLMKK